MSRAKEQKLDVSHPSDPWEREADRTAKSVLSGSGPLVLPKPTGEQPEVMRACDSCASEKEDDEEKVRVDRKEASAGTPGESPGRLDSIRGQGAPLDGEVRAFFEPRFGWNFEDVRIHRGTEADHLARSMNARAFTSANDVVFKSGEYRPEDSGGRFLLAHELAHVVQQSEAATPAIQRKEEVEARPSSLIVDDEAADLPPGAMRKTEFLEALVRASCMSADEALASVGRSTEGCPLVSRWFDTYKDKPAAYIERALKKYAPEAANAQSAGDYIPVVAERVRAGVTKWASTGELPALPEGMDLGLGAFGSLLGASGELGVLGALGGMFFKGRPGQEIRSTPDLEPLRSAGPGRSLDPNVRRHMEPAFGHDFSRVRVHTHDGVSSMAGQMQARAFTVGEHIAFSPGEYQPGTITGDALIAHELAHVAQQSSGPNRPLALQQDAGLENEADHAAARALLSTRSGESAWLSRAGLRLQRCGCENKSMRDVHERAKNSPFAPERAPTKEQLEKEAKDQAASAARAKANPDVFDPEFFPEVNVKLGKESYCYDFSLDEGVLYEPQFCEEGDGCIKPMHDRGGAPKIKVDSTDQSIGTTKVKSPVSIDVQLGYQAVWVMYLPSNRVGDVYDHEESHIFDAFNINEQIKIGLARAIRMRIMEARKKAASDPANIEKYLGAEATKQIVDEERLAWETNVLPEMYVRSVQFHRSDKKTPFPASWKDFKKPPLTKGKRGSFDGQPCGNVFREIYGTKK